MTAADPFHLSDAEIDRLIEDDLPYGDLTTRACGISARSGTITFHARDPLILSGIEEAARIFTRLGADVPYAAQAGLNATPGTALLTATGPAGALHAGWKVSQILMEWASGIATATGRIVAAARTVRADIPVAVTRKSAPFTKKLALKAVLAGGGSIHRFGLSDSVLIFAEHRAFLPTNDVGIAIATLRIAAREHAIGIEVSSLEDALAAQAADVIQLEKFSPEMVRTLCARIVKRPDGRPIIAPAGGITAENAPAYAAAGADLLVSSAPFQAKPTDIQVRFHADIDTP